MRLILDGYRDRDILDAVKAPAPVLGQALQSVARELADLAETDPKLQTGFCLAACRDLYRRTLEVGDFEAALRCIVEFNRIARQQRPPIPAGPKALAPPIDL